MSVFSSHAQHRKSKGRKIMTETINEANWAPDPETDAQMAARWAAEALQAGRYELGRALANIAANAHRAQLHVHEQYQERVAQNLDMPRTGRPSESDTTPMWEDSLAQMSEQPNGDVNADMAALPPETPTAIIPAYSQEAQTEIFGPPAEPRLDVPPSTRCAYVIRKWSSDGQIKTDSMCHEPIWWEETPGAPGHTGIWHHVNPAVDQHHGADPGSNWGA